MIRFWSVLVLGLSIAGAARAQQNLIYNHFFINPYLYNPSYIAPSGYTELHLNYRKQWAQFTGAPTTTTLNLQVPINYRMGFGVNVYNDQVGILQTNSALFSFAYQVYLGKSTNDLHRIGFGMSAGATMNRINLDKADNPDDPSLANVNTTSIDGQFGINYQYNNLKIGFALPRLFQSRIVSANGFDTPQLDQLNYTLSSISYNFTLTPRVALEPFILYRTSEGVEGQYEVAGVVKFDNLLWAGGSYRQNSGPAGFLGFNMKDKLRVGYAYEFSPEQTTGLGNGSHEVQVILRIGKKKHGRPVAAIQEPANEPVIAQEPEAKNEKPRLKPEEKVETQPQAVIATVTEPVKTEETAVEIVDPPVAEPETKAEPEKEKIVTLTGRDLKPGHYVVVGVFRSNQNALNHMNNLKKEGYPNATVAYSATKQYYYIHMGNLATLEEAAQLRDQYRKETKSSLRDTWVLSVE